MARSKHTSPGDMTVNSGNGRSVSRRLIVGIVGIVVAISIIGVWIWYRTTHNKTAAPVARTVCTDSTLVAAANTLAPVDNKQLLPVVEQIKNTEGFTEDPNCLYVVLTYYINISDPSEARTYFNDLEKVYGPAVGYNEIIAPGSLSMEQLGATVAFLEQQQATVQDTRLYVPPRPQQ